MGRHHNFKLPDHLYLSPPSPEPSSVSLTSAVSLLSLKSAPYIFPAALIQETSTTAFAVGGKIPGFKTSAAFLTTLRANINLNLELPDSQLNTPDSLRPVDLALSVSSLRSHQDLTMVDKDFAPPSALDIPRATLSDEPPASETAETRDPNYIPPLITITCQNDKERTEALKLVADSVAQQRQITSRVLIFHPITLAVLVAVGATLYKYFYKGDTSDLVIIATTFIGVLMSIFALIRAVAGGYIDEAERVGTWKWLESGRSIQAEEESGTAILGMSDEIILTKFGDEAIGAIIFRGVQPSMGNAKKTKSKSTSSPQRVEIRAWTVKQKYRHKGVGTALIEDAIKASYDKGWASGGFSFAEHHANHKRILPAMFNGAMDRREDKARALLQEKVDEYASGSGKNGRRKR